MAKRVANWVAGWVCHLDQGVDLRQNGRAGRSQCHQTWIDRHGVEMSAQEQLFRCRIAERIGQVRGGSAYGPGEETVEDQTALLVGMVVLELEH